MSGYEDWQELVRQFYIKFKRPVRDVPTDNLERDEVGAMISLLGEEVAELMAAMERGDLEKVADGVGDVIYVVLGVALQYGIDADRAIRVVHDSNMTREVPNGFELQLQKVPRGVAYVPPNIEDALRAPAEEEGQSDEADS